MPTCPKCGFYRSKEQVKNKVRSAMKTIQRRPERVRKYFEAPVIACAAG